MTKRWLFFWTAIALGLASQPVFAVPIDLQVGPNDPFCDSVLVPPNMHELGNVGIFPANEAIAAVVVQFDFSPCPAMDNLQIPNWHISIQNRTGTSWTDLFFVEAGPATHSNPDDKQINVAKAFRIDNVGNNQPLIAEIGGNIAGVFEPNEVWRFVVQDYGYQPVFQAPGNFSTPGLVGVNDPQVSIVARQVPEPGCALLILVGAGLLTARRRWLLKPPQCPGISR